MILTVKNLEKIFSTQSIFSSLSFELQATDCLVITGKNGSGKSTVIKCLAQSLAWDSGEMKIDGAPYNPRTHLSRISCLHAEDNSYLPHLTVVENLRLFCAVRNLSNAQFTEGLARVGRYLPIEALLHQNLSRLSRGGRQLFYLARCLMDLGAELFLMDEPIAHLDSGRVDSFFKLIRFLRDDQRKSFVITTQENQIHSIAAIPHKLITLKEDAP